MCCSKIWFYQFRINLNKQENDKYHILLQIMTFLLHSRLSAQGNAAFTSAKGFSSGRTIMKQVPSPSLLSTEIVPILIVTSS